MHLGLALGQLLIGSLLMTITVRDNAVHSF